MDTTAIIGGTTYNLPRLKWFWHRAVQTEVVELLGDLDKMAALADTSTADMSGTIGVMDLMTSMIDKGLKVIAAGIKQAHDEALAADKRAGASAEALANVAAAPTADDLAMVLELGEWTGLLSSVGIYVSRLVPQEAGEAVPAQEGTAGTEVLTPSSPN